MNKKKIIAVCGKSATGKDTLSKILTESLIEKGYDAGCIISDTTRPRRLLEEDGVDYNFLNEFLFISNGLHGKYIEYTHFKDWYYGTSTDSITHEINIGIFNPEGVKNLCKYHHEYNIFVVYLKANVFKRFFRMIKRECYFRFEFLRRIIVDRKDFKRYNIYKEMPHIVVKNDVLAKTAQDIVQELENQNFLGSVK
jgi:guanylate kinase